MVLVALAAAVSLAVNLAALSHHVQLMPLCRAGFDLSKVIKSGLCLSFCCRFFHESVSFTSSNSYRFF